MCNFLLIHTIFCMPTGNVENTAMNIVLNMNGSGHAHRLFPISGGLQNGSLSYCTMSLLTTAKIAVRGLGHIALPPIAESY